MMQRIRSWVSKLTLGVSAVAMLAFVVVRVVGAQVPHVRIPMVSDWSHKHIVFSQPTTWVTAWRLQGEPRYWQQAVRRSERRFERVEGELQSEVNESGEFDQRRRRWRQWQREDGFQRDWGQSLGAGGTTGAPLSGFNWWPVYPAKFSLDANAAPDCTNDFVAFPTNRPGVTGGQASIIAFNKLYVGGLSSLCGSLLVVNPSTYWSYNTNFNPAGGATNGTVQTSLSLSLDGSKLAFVETRTLANGGAILHLLKWHAGDGGAISTALAPTIATQWTADGAAGHCPVTGACMISFVLNGAQPDTGSSPLYDYVYDALYVGDDNGVLHKFINVFGRTGAIPSEVLTGHWPITVNAGTMMTSPTLDNVSRNIFMSDSSGRLSYVRETLSSAGACAVAGTVPCLGSTHILPAAAHVIPDAPIVDSSTGKVFIFFGNDGGGDGSIIQSDITLSASVRASLGAGTAHHAHSGDFDNTYFTGNGSVGSLYACGLVTGNIPTIQRVGFTNTGGPFANPVGTMKTAVDSVSLAVGTGSAECGPITEFFNANAPAASRDQIFFGVQNLGSGTNCGGAGCVMSINVTGTPATLAIANSIAEINGPSGIIVDNNATAAQASSLYFSNQGNSTLAVSCGSILVIGVGCAVKVTQSGLN